MNRRRWIGVSLGVAAAVSFRRLPVLGSWSSGLPSKIRIAPADEPGERLLLTGRVVGEDGVPRGGVEIDAYHTDAKGLYRPDRTTPSWPERPPRLQGVLATGADGSYTIDTILPGPYPGGGNPAHIHFHVGGHLPWRGGSPGSSQAETLWFEGDPRLTPEQIRTETARASGTFCAIRPLVREGGVLRCVRDFRIRERGNDASPGS